MDFVNSIEAENSGPVSAPSALPPAEGHLIEGTSAFDDPPIAVLRTQVAGDTDIGGGRENQDDYFIWERKADSIMVICVLDGHGRDVGKNAAEAGKCFFLKYFDDNYQYLLTDPSQFLLTAFVECHQYIKSSFRSILSALGWEVSEAPEGYLLKRRLPTQPWMCVHGGSSCSIVAIIGTKCYIANVGDSSGILCLPESINYKSKVIRIADGADVTRVADTEIAESDQETASTFAITAEHSPESYSEFDRLRRFKPRDGDPKQPSLLVVYDAQTPDKTVCSAVFRVDDEGRPTITNNGKYYKNVRKEWASLVATPSTARFQDALAFTRSLGDLHLQIYGVSHLPEINMIDLNSIFSACRRSQSNRISAPKEDLTGDFASSTLCIVLCTDGVWDNWVYEDVSKFVLDESCISAVRNSSEGARRVVQSFMQRNALYSKRNFGSQADNATGIVLYISTHPCFPEAP